MFIEIKIQLRNDNLRVQNPCNRQDVAKERNNGNIFRRLGNIFAVLDKKFRVDVEIFFPIALNGVFKNDAAFGNIYGVDR